MNNLNIKYHNVDIEEIAYLIKKDIEIVDSIHNEILNMPALNITYNEELLNQTIINANNFSKNKNHFMIFGTGGSNMGSKALINILHGKEKSLNAPVKDESGTECQDWLVDNKKDHEIILSEKQELNQRKDLIN